MKFWNKHPDVRRRCWSRVVLPPEASGGMLYQTYRGWYMRRQYDELFRSLQQNPSKGKFYMTIMIKEIWFEREGDATWFILTM